MYSTFSIEVYVHVQYMYTRTRCGTVHVMVSDMWCVLGNVTCTQNRSYRTVFAPLPAKVASYPDPLYKRERRLVQRMQRLCLL